MGGRGLDVAGSANGDASVVHTTAALQRRPSERLALQRQRRLQLDRHRSDRRHDQRQQRGRRARGGAVFAANRCSSRPGATRSASATTPASLQANSVSWSRGNETGTVQSVAARYVEETNLYRASAPGHDILPDRLAHLGSPGQLLAARTDTPGVAVGMTYRHREAAVGPSGVGSQGAFIAVVPGRGPGGLRRPFGSPRARRSRAASSRATSAGGYGIAPRVVARYDVGDETYVFVSGLYRVAESGIGSGTVHAARRVDRGRPVRGRAAGLLRGNRARVERRSCLPHRGLEAARRRGRSRLFRGRFPDATSTASTCSTATPCASTRLPRRHDLSGRSRPRSSARYGQIDGAVAPGTVATYGVSRTRAAISGRPGRESRSFPRAPESRSCSTACASR